MESGSILLDIGTFLGTDLRRLVFDGAPSDKIYAVDIVSHWDVGFDLFCDRDKFKAKFVEADLMTLPDGNEELKNLKGRVDVINISAVFHQWDWDTQIEAAKKVVAFSKPPGNDLNSGTLVVGYQIGHLQGDATVNPYTKVKQYRHDPTTFAKMWDLVGEQTGTKWETKAWLRAWEYLNWDPEDQKWLDKDDRVLDFFVTRVG